MNEVLSPVSTGRSAPTPAPAARSLSEQVRQTPAAAADAQKEYRELVEDLAKAKSKEIFSNGRVEHAAIIFETFLKFAKTSVNFFCYNMLDEVFDQDSFIEKMEIALVRGVKITIVTQETPKGTKLLEKIKSWKSNSNLQIEVLLAAGSDKTAKANFATMDGAAYRFEPNREEQVAYACMNAADSARQLDQKFLRIKTASIMAAAVL